MRGIAVNFNGSNSSISNKIVEGIQLTSQKCLLNMATEAGMDRLYPTRGVDILSKAVAGAITDNNIAQHLGNFAALDTIFFVRETDYNKEDKDRVSDLDILPIAAKGSALMYIMNVYTLNEELSTKIKL